MKNYITGIIWIIKDRSRLKKIYPDFTFDNWFKTLKNYHHSYTKGADLFFYGRKRKADFKTQQIIKHLKSRFGQ